MCQPEDGEEMTWRMMTTWKFLRLISRIFSHFYFSLEGSREWGEEIKNTTREVDLTTMMMMTMGVASGQNEEEMRKKSSHRTDRLTFLLLLPLVLELKSLRRERRKISKKLWMKSAALCAADDEQRRSTKRAKWGECSSVMSSLGQT